jgi:TPR repeat protein
MKEDIEACSGAERFFLDAENAEEREDYDLAAVLLARAAIRGHTGAQVNLGNFYSCGRGVPHSSSKAAFWYQRAYRNGDESGALNLAIDRLKEGNTRSAIFWFKRAIEMHSGEAAVELAKLYLRKARGRAKAIELLRAAKTMSPSEISEEARKSAVALLASIGRKSGSIKAQRKCRMARR